MMMTRAYKVNEEHLDYITDILGKFWSPIGTLKGDDANLEIMPASEEVKTIVELLLVSTNFELGERTITDLKDQEAVQNMCRILRVLKQYVPNEISDKMSAIITMYSGEMTL